MQTTVNTTAKIEEFFNSLDSQLKINDNLINYVDIEDIDESNIFDSIYDMVQEKGGFDIEVIYYSNAIEYLSEYDNSLQRSLGIAADMGFELTNLNSEVLASLLKSEDARDEFTEFRDEIESFFSDLTDEEEEDEEETV